MVSLVEGAFAGAFRYREDVRLLEAFAIRIVKISDSFQKKQPFVYWRRLEH